MKRISMIALFSAMACMAFGQSMKPVLFIHDGELKENKPYIDAFRAAFEAEGVYYEEAAAAEIGDVSRYDFIVIYGIVQAFNMESPLRDWLKEVPGPALAGKKAALFVTANRWSLKALDRDLRKFLRKNGAEVVDGTTMATKDLNTADKEAAVSGFVKRTRTRIKARD